MAERQGYHIAVLAGDGIGPEVTAAARVVLEAVAALYDRQFVYEDGLIGGAAIAQDPAMADIVRSRIRDLLPAVAESVSPPSEGAFDALGVDEGALAEFGFGALNRRLAIIGVEL